MKKNFYQKRLKELSKNPRKWLITGVAGFIGSNILETLLKNDQFVVGLDNFSTGYKKNLDQVKSCVSNHQWKKFKFINGDICKINDCKKVVKNIDYVLHQAALGSVPRSIADPITSNKSNVSGFLNMLTASKDENVSNFVYAASSSTYGDHKLLPKVEEIIGKPLSPYAVTKYINEMYADVFFRTYGFNSIGLRYFNVFGPRQNPQGAYAAVIPKWIASFIKKEKIIINGDGTTSRDFCFIDNVVQANILAATTETNSSKNNIYNIAKGDRTSLIDLLKIIEKNLIDCNIDLKSKIVNKEFRPGDVLHSQADISKAINLLHYDPTDNIETGVAKSVKWYVKHSDIFQ